MMQKQITKQTCKIEGPEINSYVYCYIYGQLIFNKGTNTIHW